MQLKLNRYQLTATALWIFISGGMAIYRTLQMDPIGQDGHKCIFPDSIGQRVITLEEDKKPNPEINFAAGVDPIFVKVDANPFGDKDCSSSSTLALYMIYTLRLHPIAGLSGSLLPTIALAPFAYFWSGSIIQRITARANAAKSKFKTCEFCAEQIKAEAKVCRYCGRDVK